MRTPEYDWFGWRMVAAVLLGALAATLLWKVLV